MSKVPQLCGPLFHFRELLCARWERSSATNPVEASSSAVALASSEEGCDHVGAVGELSELKPLLLRLARRAVQQKLERPCAESMEGRGRGRRGVFLALRGSGTLLVTAAPIIFATVFILIFVSEHVCSSHCLILLCARAPQNASLFAHSDQ